MSHEPAALMLWVPCPASNCSQKITPLIAAAKNGHGGIVSLLLDHGADMHCLTKNYQTALHVAVAKNHTEVGCLESLKSEAGLCRES